MLKRNEKKKRRKELTDKDGEKIKRI